MITTERVLRLLEPAYVSELTPRSFDELRAMHDECSQAELALSYWNLAAVRGDLGRTAEAEAGFRKSVDMYTRIDSMYPDLVPCLEEYARILERVGRGAEAKSYRARAERIRGALSSSTSGTR